VSRVRTGGRAEAVAHLDKAQEFLDNAKEALCFALIGGSTAADDHKSAVTELRSVGQVGRESAAALDRLLGLKDRAQYDRRGVTATEAQAALRRAATMVEAADRVLR